MKGDNRSEDRRTKETSSGRPGTGEDNTWRELGGLGNEMRTAVLRAGEAAMGAFAAVGQGRGCAGSGARARSCGRLDDESTQTLFCGPHFAYAVPRHVTYIKAVYNLSSSH